MSKFLIKRYILELKLRPNGTQGLESKFSWICIYTSAQLPLEKLKSEFIHGRLCVHMYVLNKLQEGNFNRTGEPFY